MNELSPDFKTPLTQTDVDENELSPDFKTPLTQTDVDEIAFLAAVITNAKNRIIVGDDRFDDFVERFFYFQMIYPIETAVILWWLQMETTP